MKDRLKKNIYHIGDIESIPIRKMGFYEKYGKRSIDVFCAVCTILVFSPLFLVLGLLVRIELGAPILFVQDRPGLIGKDGKETIFKIYKYRTMTNEVDVNGELLSDEKRMTKFGLWLRNTSLDELPEVFNILNGTMSVVGPRPQLVRDMTFMSKEQRMRHTAKPGLSGLAQINGRNGISWERKFEIDLEYIKKISFFGDLKIVVQTIKEAFFKREGITQGNFVTGEDFGDYLLRTKKITNDEYIEKQALAKTILEKKELSE